MHIRNFIRIQCLMIALVMSWQFASAATYYISSTEGDDSRTSAQAQSAATPWRTLSKLSAIALQPGDQVLLKRGDEFRESYTITRSGTSGNPIIFGAYGEPLTAYPKIAGSNLITGWTPSSFNPSVYYAQVSYAVKDLFVNGKRQIAARHPNTGWLQVDAMNGKTGLSDAALKQGNGYFNNAKIRIRTRDWAYEVRTIASYSPGQITFDKATKYESGANFSYYIDGLLSLLDAPGEWNYDAAQGRVYYWPEGGGTPANLRIEGGEREAGINVSWGVHFVTIQQLEFTHHIKSLNVPNNNNTVEVKNCYFHDITYLAIGHSGVNGRIESNLITDCLDRGIVAHGNKSVIKDNDIKNIGIVPGYGGSDWGYIALNAAGEETTISYNRIDKVGYIGMEVGGKNMVVEKNVVQYCLYLLNDGSAIAIPFGGTDMTFRNNFMLHSVGNLDTKSKNNSTNDKNEPLAHGFYFGGKNNQRITVQGNTMAYNAGAAFSAIETYTSTLADNVAFGNDKGIYFLDMEDYGSQHNNTIKNNVFYSLAENHPSVYALQFPSGEQQHNYGTFSNNYYYNPYSNTTFRFQYNPSSWRYNQYSPSTFRSAPNGDPDGKASFLSLSPYVASCNARPPGTDLIVNGSFNTALAPWFGSSGGGACSGSSVASYSSHPLLSGGAARINNLGCFSAPFWQNGLKVVANQFYKLTFSCAANSASSLEVRLGKQNWTVIGMEKAEVFICEPKKNTYTYIFKATETDANARLVLSNKKAGTEIWVDDISLVPVDVTYDDPKERSQLFINPSDDPKTIALSSTFWDIDQNEVSGSITLAPWTSKVLIKKDIDPCANQLPTITLNNPEGGPGFTTGSTINLTATASDADGQVVKVEFFQGNVKLGESTSAPYSFAWVNPPAGSYQISAKATDDKGGTKVSNLVSITVAGPSYTVTFTVKDAANVVVPDASVAFNGQTLTSDNSGVVTFVNVPSGNNLPYSVSKTGFSPSSGLVSVASANVTQDVVLTANSSPSYTVTFTIKDANNALVSGALVTFNGQNVTTTATGQAVFNDVSPGSDLPYSISKTGFNTNTGLLSVVSSNVTKDVLLTAIPTYQVTFTVKYTNNVLAVGALVDFNGQKVFTTANGQAVFNNVASGNDLAYRVSKAGFNEALGTLSVTSSNVTQDVVLTAIPTYTVTFTVQDAANVEVPDASVTFNGQTLTSDNSGVVTFTNVASGSDLPYSVSKTGFSFTSGSLDVTSSPVTQNVVLTAIAGSTYRVTFTVKDANNGSVPGALVTFNGQQVTTTATGQAIFNNVASGSDLAYIASKAGYNNRNGTLSVTSSDVTQNVELTAIGSPTYTVTFTVKDANNVLVRDASVNFDGREVVTTSDGRAVFNNISPGSNLSYRVSKTGYNDRTSMLNVGSANVAQNVVLTDVASPTYRVTFTVKDVSNVAVPGASVTFNGQNVTTTTTGEAVFNNVSPSPGNNLPYRVSKAGYYNEGGTLKVVSDQVAQNVVLTIIPPPDVDPTPDPIPEPPSPTIYTITFTVKDAANVLVPGALVNLNGQDVTTTETGQAVFNNIPPGSNFSYSVSKPGFDPNTGLLSITSFNVTRDVVLNAIPAYTVTFTVKDVANVAVPGALVNFNGQDVTTTENGLAVFTNIASGNNLSYSVSKISYNNGTGTLDVTSANVAENVVLTLVTSTPESELVAQLNPRNIFSPNGDGVNELWEVVGIEQQPELRVLIFNMHGQQVFQAQPYTNSWDGASLPEGVYYYQVQNPQGKLVKKGSLTLVR